MIYPRYNRWYRRFWSWYFRHIIRSDFSGFELVGTPPELAADKSVLLLQNHISWWDGFWAYRLNDLYFGRRFHVMMLEEELAKRKFLTYAGAFSIRKSSRSVVESLRFGTQLLQDPQNLLLLFPQGKIESQQVARLHFGKGVERVIQQSAEHTQVVMAAVFPDYFSSRKPLLRIYLRHLPTQELHTHTDWEVTFNSFYQESRQRQSQL